MLQGRDRADLGLGGPCNAIQLNRGKQPAEHARRRCTLTRGARCTRIRRVGNDSADGRARERRRHDVIVFPLASRHTRGHAGGGAAPMRRMRGSARPPPPPAPHFSAMPGHFSVTVVTYIYRCCSPARYNQSCLRNTALLFCWLPSRSSMPVPRRKRLKSCGGLAHRILMPPAKRRKESCKRYWTTLGLQSRPLMPSCVRSKQS